MAISIVSNAGTADTDAVVVDASKQFYVKILYMHVTAMRLDP